MVDKKMKSGVVSDTIVLTFVKIVTLFVSIVQTMMLSRYLSKTEYGTYSEGLLVISFFAPFFSLGLNDSVNYFCNKESDNNRIKYLNTIFMLSIVAGGIGGILLFIFKDLLAAYYKNTQIIGIVIYVAFRPLLQNLIALYQPVYVSIGKTKVIAIRNFLISLVQVLIIGGFIFASIRNLMVVFAALFVMDVVQILFFDRYLRKLRILINPLRADNTLIKEILRFAIPMLLSASIGTVSINIDKLMISNLLTVEDYALYANVSKQLPFSFFVSSLTAVVSPIIVKLLTTNQFDKFKSVWSNYLELGYMTTWPICFIAILFAPEIISILYSTKYLTNDGVIIFRLYTIAAMLGFTYFGLIPTSFGNTKIVLKYSMLNMVLNIVLNISLFHFWGILGPAIATIISMIIPSFLYFYNSLKLTNTKFIDVISIKKIVLLVLEMLLAGIISTLVVGDFVISKNPVIKLIIGFCVYMFVLMPLQYKNIKMLIVELNRNSLDH